MVQMLDLAIGQRQERRTPITIAKRNVKVVHFTVQKILVCCVTMLKILYITLSVGNRTLHVSCVLQNRSCQSTA